MLQGFDEDDAQQFSLSCNSKLCGPYQCCSVLHTKKHRLELYKTETQTNRAHPRTPNPPHAQQPGALGRETILAPAKPSGLSAEEESLQLNVVMKGSRLVATNHRGEKNGIPEKIEIFASITCSAHVIAGGDHIT